jgi:hypothetical protein
LSNLIIYIELHKERSFNFENKILSHIKETHPNDTLLDLDNFSSPELFKYTLDACQEEDHLILIINSKEKNTPLGPVLSFVNKSIRSNKLKISSYLIGENQTAKKMLARTKSLKTITAIDFLKSDRL